VHVSGAEDGDSRGSRNQLWNWWSGLDGCIWETVRGGLLTNWCARAGWATIWRSIVESGVETSVRSSSAMSSGTLGAGEEGSLVSVAVTLRSGVASMSPGATGRVLEIDHFIFWRGEVGETYRLASSAVGSSLRAPRPLESPNSYCENTTFGRGYNGSLPDGCDEEGTECVSIRDQ
jgi:hypothetical protein